MKKQFFILTFGLFLVASCSKQTPFDEQDELPDANKTVVSCPECPIFIMGTKTALGGDWPTGSYICLSPKT